MLLVQKLGYSSHTTLFSCPFTNNIFILLHSSFEILKTNPKLIFISPFIKKFLRNEIRILTFFQLRFSTSVHIHIHNFHNPSVIISSIHRPNHFPKIQITTLEKQYVFKASFSNFINIVHAITQHHMTHFLDCNILITILFHLLQQL